jgi:energy-coupling factor transporter ATP-binding protein EcfA2
MTNKLETERGFPPDLLDQPWEARVDFFKRYISYHALLRDTYKKLRSAIRIPTSGRIIMVYGPSGVGKTTLREGIQRKITEEMMPQLIADPGRIPIVGVKVEAPDAGNFDWKRFYKDMLKSLDEVLIDQKINYRVPGVSRNKEGNLVLEQGANKQDLSDAVFSALEHRRPIAIIADEAQDMGIISSGRKLIDQMSRIKHLADKFEIPFVLIGTFGLLKFRLLNEQLSRRAVEIHFWRYRAEREEDVEEFKDILNSFQKKMALVEEPDLEGRWEYFYERTLGCVGVLKDWLTQAFQTSLENGEQSLKNKYIEFFQPPMSSCSKKLDEILDKEKEIIEAEEKEKLADYRKRLKLVQSNDDKQKTKMREKPEPQEKDALKPAATKRKGKPFERGPKRDHVGVEELVAS